MKFDEIYWAESSLVLAHAAWCQQLLKTFENFFSEFRPKQHFFLLFDRQI